METKTPYFLNEMLTKQYGEELTVKIIEGYSKKRKVTFRVNTIKSNREEIVETLKENNIEFEDVKFSKDAFVVNNASEKILQELDIYKDGKIYLQSLSSMLPPIILNPQEGKDILDMAAAPGGKTTQMATITNNKAHITACEINKIRMERLKYNIEKQGATNVFIMQKDASKLDDFFSFDQILLDAPCSGSGTINLKDEKLEKYFTEKLIQNCTKVQYEMLKKALKILKPGCEMVYSTCSILQKENEDIVSKVLKENNVKMVPIDIKIEDGIEILPTKINGTLCVMPNEFFEGFFIAKIIKEK